MALLLAAAALVACSESDPIAPHDGPEPPGPPDLVADSVATLSVNDLSASLDRNGVLGDVRLRDASAHAIFAAGLWLGAEVAGAPHGSIVWVGADPFSVLSSRRDEDWIGPYHVTLEHFDNPETVWPLEHGFPVDEEGLPVLYGEEMLWASFRVDETRVRPESVQRAPLPGLEVRQSVFGVDEPGLERALYFRWDLVNDSSLDWTDVHVGLYSDTDLVLSGGAVGGNLTGYVPDKGITFTYQEHFRETTRQLVSAWAFLLSPAVAAPNHFATAHRIVWKNFHDDYGEEGFDRPEQILWALQGRTNSGAPVLDPSTAEETPYALSGDPMTGLGWVDDPPRDVRGLLASGPFDVAAGDSVSVIGVWVLAEGSSFPLAYNRMIAEVDEARRQAHRVAAGRRE